MGDLVFFINHKTLSKQEIKWRHGSYIVKEVSPLTFYIEKQFTGKIYRTHAKDIRKSSFDCTVPTDEYASKSRAAICADFSDTEDSFSPRDFLDSAGIIDMPVSGNTTSTARTRTYR